MSTTGGSEQGTVHLLDEPDAIRRKFKRAVTDSDDPPVLRRGDDKPGVTNLIDILASVRGVSQESVEQELASARGYGDLKAAVGDAVVEALAPLQERYRAIRAGRAGARGRARRRRRQGARDRRRDARGRARARWASGPPRADRGVRSMCAARGRASATSPCSEYVAQP